MKDKIVSVFIDYIGNIRLKDNRKREILEEIINSNSKSIRDDEINIINQKETEVAL